MHILDTVTILCTALLTGNELTVSLFINPVMRQLDERAQAKALRLFAALLGKAMPIWYALSLLLIAIEAYLHRHQPAFPWIVASAILWLGIILYTILALLPINNRIASLDLNSPPADWLQQHHTWEIRHRLRIALLIVSISLLTYHLL